MKKRGNMVRINDRAALAHGNLFPNKKRKGPLQNLPEEDGGLSCTHLRCHHVLHTLFIGPSSSET